MDMTTQNFVKGYGVIVGLLKDRVEVDDSPLVRELDTRTKKYIKE
jgi:hypothetical protein